MIPPSSYVCICGHAANTHEHFHPIETGWMWCRGCVGISLKAKPIHKFKLDNLMYVELLAKEKGLI
jgi:hypothetical protein